MNAHLLHFVPKSLFVRNSLMVDWDYTNKEAVSWNIGYDTASLAFFVCLTSVGMLLSVMLV